MKNEFVPYEEALALKELGFNEQCFFVYNRKNELVQKSPTIPLEYCINIDGGHGAQCTAPLYQQAFRWFREKHKAYPVFSSPVEGIVKCHIPNVGYCDYPKYEDAELGCLKILIEITKENGK